VQRLEQLVKDRFAVESKTDAVAEAHFGRRFGNMMRQRAGRKDAAVCDAGLHERKYALLRHGLRDAVCGIIRTDKANEAARTLEFGRDDF